MSTFDHESNGDNILLPSAGGGSALPLVPLSSQALILNVTKLIPSEFLPHLSLVGGGEKILAVGMPLSRVTRGFPN